MTLQLDTVHTDYLEYLDAQIEDQEENKPFAIDSANKAEWALRRVAEAQRGMAAREEFVAREIDRLNAWREAEDKRDQGTVDYMESLLYAYYETLRATGALGRRKVYKLPSGEITTRTTQPKYKRDDSKLLQYAREIGEVRVKAEPDWSAIRGRIRPVAEHPGAEVVDTETGEIIPGVLVELPAGERFSVKVVE